MTGITYRWIDHTCSAHQWIPWQIYLDWVCDCIIHSDTRSVSFHHQPPHISVSFLYGGSDISIMVSDRIGIRNMSRYRNRYIYIPMESAEMIYHCPQQSSWWDFRWMYVQDSVLQSSHDSGSIWWVCIPDEIWWYMICLYRIAGESCRIVSPGYHPGCIGCYQWCLYTASQSIWYLSDHSWPNQMKWFLYLWPITHVSCSQRNRYHILSSCGGALPRIRYRYVISYRNRACIHQMVHSLFHHPVQESIWNYHALSDR